jgi:uncharacterized protein YcaQ
VPERVSAPRARRIALAAQGFTKARRHDAPGLRHVLATVQALGAVQIDSVNVVVRSQELPLWARLGAHPRDALARLQASGRTFEYWGHEASHLPAELHPLLRWRMERAAAGIGVWGGLARLFRERPGYVEAVFAEVAERGPLQASQLSDPGRKSGPWWGWNHGKQALEWLFWCGRLCATRGPNFERRYDLPERVLPATVLAAPTPPAHDAQKALLATAARALGVATERDLADYFRLNAVAARPLVHELVEEGRLVPAAVEGWRDPAFLHPEAVAPRRVGARALLSPFDSLVWERDRAERLFGFRYRLELYTPAPRRVYGYYVLPFLLGDALVARVDVKADRAGSTLRLQAAHAEPGVDVEAVADALTDEATAMAAWLNLERVAVGERGDLAGPLARRLARSSAAPRAATGPRPAPTPGR